MILVAVATYNEIENLPTLVEGIFAHLPDCHLLIVDDNSPDGTGKWCDDLAERDDRVRCLHRKGKLGLGSATVAGLEYAVQNGYEYVITMDADLSHPPRYLPSLVQSMSPNDDGEPVSVAIGSRYVPGGGVEGWPLNRRIMSRALNTYVRWVLRLRTHDNSGAFRCYRCKTLERLDFRQIESRGYSFFEEILYHLKRLGVRFVEIPIIFVDREHGNSKIDRSEAVAALKILTRLALFGPRSTP